MTQSKRRLFLIQALLKERPELRSLQIPRDTPAQKHLLQGLMNVRAPKKCSAEVLRIQDEYLTAELFAKGITDVNSLSPVSKGIYLWQGDITTLRCDAIVNAASSGMTGCYIPNHHCIDNAIHTYAGMELRLACAEIMRTQGHDGLTGQAQITSAYNLPCKYILHTTGPVIMEKPLQEDQELLAKCYYSCLSLAAEKQLESIAFCCISTGEFHFPKELAAKIAICTVRNFLQQCSSVKKVIFTVSQKRDKEIYEQLLGIV